MLAYKLRSLKTLQWPAQGIIITWTYCHDALPSVLGRGWVSAAAATVAAGARLSRDSP